MAQPRNATNAPAVISGIGMLQHLMDATARGIYWGFAAARAPGLHWFVEGRVLSCLATAFRTSLTAGGGGVV